MSETDRDIGEESGQWDGYLKDPGLDCVVREVFQAIVDEFSNKLILTPSTEGQWHVIAAAFCQRWNFHHVLGNMSLSRSHPMMVLIFTTTRSSVPSS